MERELESRLNVQIYEEACEWFVEFRSGTMDAERCRQADRWLRKSPEQLSAYLEIAAIWNDGPSLVAPGLYPLDELVARASSDIDNVVAFRESPDEMARVDSDIEPTIVSKTEEGEEGEPPPPVATAVADRWRDSRFSRTPVWCALHSFFFARATCATVAAAALVAGSLWYLDTVRGRTFATLVGEQRSFELADGSTVSLNSRSTVRIRYSEHRRDVQLLDGQALFHVAKDSARPFIVKANGTEVRAVGTEFDVYQKPTGTLVTVVEGRVAVLPGSHSGEAPSALSMDAPSAGTIDPGRVASGLSLPSGSPGPTGNILLGAGEQLSVTGNRVIKIEHANVANATAWTHRELIFEYATLADVAEEFNRYNVRPLVIADTGLDTFHISGIFSSTDSATIIGFLRSRPGLRVVETLSAVRIEKKIP